MNPTSAYLLVFHGSRHYHYAAKTTKLANLVQSQLTINHATHLLSSQTKKLQNSNLFEPLVESAMLELAPLSLAESIIVFCQKAIALNYQKVQIVPVFLAAGVHVTEDIPREIAQAQQQLNHQIEIQLLTHVGNYSQIQEVLRQRFQAIPTSGRILLAHGSRLVAGNVKSEQLARQTSAINAYWAISPDLETAVQLLVKQNISSIAIMPYFLFSGKITEAIASRVTELQNNFPNTKLLMTSPLGATLELAQVITKGIVGE